MAKVRRGLSSIAQGVREKFKNALNFGSERRNEVLARLTDEILEEEDIFEEDDDFELGENTGRVAPSPISAPVPPVDSPVMSGDMREFAESIYDRNRVDEIRAMFYVLINGFNNQLRENPAEEAEITEKLEIRKKQLEEFNKEINLIEIENQIENVIESTNNIFDDVEASLDKLVEYLDNDKFSDIGPMINHIEDLLGMGTTTATGFNVAAYQSNLAILNDAQSKYKNLSGTSYNANNSIKYFPENLIKKIYGDIESKIRQTQKDYDDIKDTDEIKASLMAEAMNQLNSLIDYLPMLLEDPNRFEKIRKDTDAILDRVHGERKELPIVKEPAPAPQPAQQQPQPAQPAPGSRPQPQSTGYGQGNSLFTIMISRYTRKIYEKIKSLMSEFKSSDEELDKLVEEFNSQVDSAPGLDESTKNKIVREEQDRYSRKLVEEFGEELYEFIYDYSTYFDKYRTSLIKYSSCTPEFEHEYSQMRAFITSMIKDGQKAGITVQFDENTQILSIDFGSDKVKPFSSQIVSDEVVKELATIDKGKDKETKEFTEKLSILIDQYEIALIDSINKLSRSSELERLRNEIEDLVDNDSKYQKITRFEKDDIYDRLTQAKLQERDAKYGVYLFEFITKTLMVEFQKIDFDSINSVEFGTQEFVNEYVKLLNSIRDFKNNVYANPKAENFIESMSYDEDSQMLIINYKNTSLGEYRKQILSDEILQKIRAAKSTGAPQPAPAPQSPQPAPAPQSAQPASAPQPAQPAPAPQPAPATSGQQASNNRDTNNPDFITAKENYINNVNELNYIIEMINDLNNRIESQAALTFIDINSAKSIAEMEKEAKALDQQMMNLKVALSKERLEIKRQFNIFVLSLPEVRNLKIAEVEFSGSLTSFIEQRDEMIVEAESKIIALDAERRNNPQNSAMLSSDIAVLLEFIEAQNSIIGRRLVEESKTNNIDIVETLKVRRENKKDMRERLQNIKSNQINPQQSTSSANLEIEYTNELRSILSEELQSQVLAARTGNGIIKPSINLSNECNQKLFMLESNPKYASINKAQIKAAEIQKLDNEYNNIVEKEQISDINMLIDALNHLFATIPPHIVKAKYFDELLKSNINEVIAQYPTIKSLRYNLDMENNSLEINFECQCFNFTTSQFEVQMETMKDSKVLNDDLRKDYEESRKTPTPSDSLKPESDTSEVKISARQLTFNPKQQAQIASKASSLIMDGNEVTISLIKNGIRIKYSQELREKLSQLNAKINLVNKDNYRNRVSAKIDSDTQDLTFKDEREIKPEDYKIEVRIPSDDKSSVLFEYDLEQVSEELKSRSR